MTTIYIYEDDPTRSQRFRQADWRFCNHGKVLFGSCPANKRWHGPFSGIEPALRYARNKAYGDMRDCLICRPRGSERSHQARQSLYTLLESHIEYLPN